jgi:hypothetical protein
LKATAKAAAAAAKAASPAVDSWADQALVKVKVPSMNTDEDLPDGDPDDRHRRTNSPSSTRQPDPPTLSQSPTLIVVDG